MIEVEPGPPVLPAAGPRHVPLQPTPLVGREADIAAVRSTLLQGQVRLLTLTGPAGTGKTRLALAVASSVAPAFAHGACFVDLAPLTAPDQVTTAIAEAVNVRDSPGAGEQSPILLVARALRERHLLLLLDNFEHVLPAAPQVAELLGACPRLVVLVTSRAALHLRWEHELPVAPLDVPNLASLPDPQTLGSVPSVALFVQQAQAVRADFRLGTANARAVAEICVRLDGLPLAIELAAARTKLLPPEALLARLQRRLQLLVGGRRDQPTRHQALRAAIGWSYDLLAPPERALFRRLGVFAGGATLEAAEAVAGGGGTDEPGPGQAAEMDVLGALQGLVDNSLVRAGGSGAEPRFTMLETLREYALERLEASGESEATHARHAAYFLGLAERGAAGLRGEDQSAWLLRLEAEHDNFRAVLARHLGHTAAPGQAGDGCAPASPAGTELALRLGAALAPFWLLHGHLTEGRRWLEPILQQECPAHAGAARARALLGAGMLADALGDDRAAHEHLQASVALGRALGDVPLLSTALGELGHVLLDLAQPERARPVVEEGLALARAGGDQRVLAAALSRAADMVEAGGDFPGAFALLEEGLVAARAAGDRNLLCSVLYGLGRLASHLGDDQRARLFLEEGCLTAQELRLPLQVVRLQRWLGRVALRQGNAAAASRHHQAGLAAAQEIDDKAGITHHLIGLAQVALLEGEPDQAESLLQRSLALADEVEHPWSRGDALRVLYEVARARQDRRRMAELLRERLSLFWDLNDHLAVAGCLNNAAGLAALAGEPTTAARLSAAARALHRAIGSPDRQRDESIVQSLQDRLGKAAFDAAWAAGAAMPLQTAVATALALCTTVAAADAVDTSPLPLHQEAAAPPARLPARNSFDLTPREIEVLRLLAAGASDSEIARQLVISVRTANAHVANILGKMGAPNRAAAAVLAQRHGLL